MLTINRAVFDRLEADRGDRYLVGVVADWFAIYEKVAGASPAIPFESALDFAQAQSDRAQARAPEIVDGLFVHLVHSQLLAMERGCPAEAALAAGDAFITAMPAARAATILLHAELGL